MGVPVISRAQWGANYRSGIQRVRLSEKTHFFVHYHGGIPRNAFGVAVPRDVEAIHHANGWSGVGYSFVTDQAGDAYEGRGYDGVAVACPGFNTSGIHVYVAIGGDQEPSAAALRKVRALYDEACELTGRRLIKMGHRDGYATACPGDKLYAWVQAGMPATEEDPFMAIDLNALVDRIRNAVLFDSVIQIIGREDKMSLATAARVTYDDTKQLEVAVAALDAKLDTLAGQVAQHSQGSVSKDEVLAEIRAAGAEAAKAKMDQAEVRFKDEAATA